MATVSSPSPSASATGLPPGISAPYSAISSQNQSGLIAILTAFALSLVLLSIAIRIYARHNFAGYRVDDLSFFSAAVLAVIQVSLVFRSLAYGQGKLIANIDAEENASIQKLSFTSDLFYLVILFISKFSTSFLFLHLTPGRTHHRVIWAGVGAEAVWVLTAVVLEGVRCGTAHPWTDDPANCSNLFARWVYIASFDCCTEMGLVATAAYLVWDLQMELTSKLIVVGAFSCRIANIVVSIVRLVLIHRPFLPETSHIWSARVISATQIAIGVSITSSIIPYLKPFMMAYDRPPSSSYPARSHGSSNFKLSALTTDRSGASAIRGTEFEDDGEVRETDRDRSRNPHKTGFSVGKLRPEQTKYSANATAAPDSNATEHEGQNDQGSEDSSLMIIKKGVEWSVQYDRDVQHERAPSAAGTAASANPDEIQVVQHHV